MPRRLQARLNSLAARLAELEKRREHDAVGGDDCGQGEAHAFAGYSWSQLIVCPQLLVSVPHFPEHAAALFGVQQFPE